MLTEEEETKIKKLLINIIFSIAENKEIKIEDKNWITGYIKAIDDYMGGI